MLLNTFRFVQTIVKDDDEVELTAHDLTVRHVISKDGKFWRGNVNITAMEYANWTVVANTPGGKLVVNTTLTSWPNAIQQLVPKKA